MSIRDVMVYLDNDKECRNRVKVAAGVCQFFEAHLVGIYITRTLVIHPYPYAYLPASAFDSLEENAIVNRDEAKANFSADSDAMGLSNEFHEGIGHLVKNLEIESRYVDLMIMPQKENNKAGYNPELLVSDTILAAACPVLLIPEGTPALKQPPRRAMIAWNGSRECARALASAMPLLGGVEEVDVVSISSDYGDLDEIALHLTRHGFNPNVHFIEGGSFDVGRKLLDQASLLDADLVVMGAYGHSRIREQILGGATQFVLDHARVPFSH